MAVIAATCVSTSVMPGLDLTKKIDLKDPAVLAERLENKEYLRIASQVALEALTQYRGITRLHKYGQVFPIRSELLAYAMELARGEVTLEIAGASGKHGILLALAGAKITYVNDIVSEEMALFRQPCQTLPREVSSRLAAVQGDCFDLLKLKPELKDSCGLVLCNNFVHFLNDKKLKEFADLLKKVLKVGGIAIITVNPKDGTEAGLAPDSRHTAFAGLHCIAVTYRDPTDSSPDKMDILAKNNDIAISGNEISFDYVNAFIYRKHPILTEKKWVKRKGEIDKLNSIDKKFATQVLSEQAIKDRIKGIQDGAIRVLKSTHRKFNETDLREFFTSHGFVVESAFVDQASDRYGRAVAIIRRSD